MTNSSDLIKDYADSIDKFVMLPKIALLFSVDDKYTGVLDLTKSFNKLINESKNKKILFVTKKAKLTITTQYAYGIKILINSIIIDAELENLIRNKKALNKSYNSIYDSYKSLMAKDNHSNPIITVAMTQTLTDLATIRKNSVAEIDRLKKNQEQIRILKSQVKNFVKMKKKVGASMSSESINKAINSKKYNDGVRKTINSYLDSVVKMASVLHNENDFSQYSKFIKSFITRADAIFNDEQKAIPVLSILNLSIAVEETRSNGVRSEYNYRDKLSNKARHKINVTSLSIFIRLVGIVNDYFDNLEEIRKDNTLNILNKLDSSIDKISKPDFSSFFDNNDSTSDNNKKSDSEPDNDEKSESDDK